jgi:N-methylhydantoinase B/oxoprolinase/acetone carboxylase alpha subunit
MNGVVPLQTGDVVRLLTPGGGGYGDAMLRDYSAVANDLRYGKISLEYAEANYALPGQTSDPTKETGSGSE